jgi:methionyl-tRNA formyltransferase
MNKVLVIGAVNSTKWILDKLFSHNFNVVGVLGLDEKKSSNISGWSDLNFFSESLRVPFKPYVNINDIENLIWAKSKKPDIIFAVGFSQLLKSEWFNVSTYGCIGFHPTKLPKGRGRAPLAWLVHELEDGAATFFLMGEGADDGPIFIQEPFHVSIYDDAHSVEKKIEISINSALDSWLPELKKGVWNPLPQNDYEASYFGKREPEDGLISWKDSAYQIDRLIKASTHPHPGAYTYFKLKKVKIWASEIDENLKIKGIVGRILKIDSIKGYLIQTGKGLLWLKLIESENTISVGNKLGINLEEEVYKLNLILNKSI